MVLRFRWYIATLFRCHNFTCQIPVIVRRNQISIKRFIATLNVVWAGSSSLTFRYLQRDVIKVERQNMNYCLQEHPELDVKFLNVRA